METQNQNVPLNSPPTEPKRNWFLRHYVLYSIIATLLLAVVASSIYFYKEIYSVSYFVYTGTKDIAAPSDPAVGKIIELNLPMVYSTDEIDVCLECSSPRTIEINRELLCFRQTASHYPHIYKDGYKHLTYVPSTTKFTVQEVFRPHHYGIISIDSGPGDYRMYVLRDHNGTLSTAVADIIDDPKRRCGTDVFYTDLHKKLLLFSENKDKVKVALTLYNSSTHKDGDSTEIDQNDIIQKLNTLPSPYHVTNIQKVDSYLPGMKAVTLETDVNSLAYIIANKLELNILEIQGLDPEFQATLTASDVAEMAGKPVNWIKLNSN